MYTLILVFWINTAYTNGGVAVHSQAIPGFANKEECDKEGRKAYDELPSTKSNHVRWSCIKAK